MTDLAQELQKAKTVTEWQKEALEARDGSILTREMLIKQLRRELAEKESRIAHLEEANASRGETRPITKEEWQENFK